LRGEDRVSVKEAVKLARAEMVRGNQAPPALVRTEGVSATEEDPDESVALPTRAHPVKLEERES